MNAPHGEPDGGAVGISGSLEKDINLAIARKLSEVLEGKEFGVIMTRNEDYGIFDEDSNTIREKKRSDMNARREIMENGNGDLFISIHMNSFSDQRAEGLNIFYSAEHESIKNLAEMIQINIATITGAKTHAVKSADEDLFLMKNPPIPALLVECGFISNPEEELKLIDEDYQSRIAWAIAEAIEQYYAN